MKHSNLGKLIIIFSCTVGARLRIAFLQVPQAKKGFLDKKNLIRAPPSGAAMSPGEFSKNL